MDGVWRWRAAHEGNCRKSGNALHCPGVSQCFVSFVSSECSLREMNADLGEDQMLHR